MTPKNNLTPVAAYIRMSSDEQTESPDQQREHIQKMADKDGYHIVRWYQDLAVSGDDTKRRTGFKKMIADAQRLQGFTAILCWDQSRFGRFKSNEAGYWTHQLELAGVSKLITVCDGVIDWSDETNLTMFNLRQDWTNRKYLTDLSRNMIRGSIQGAQQGHYGGPGLYGFDRMYFTASGEFVHRVPCGGEFRAPKGWYCKLAPAADTTLVERVRWMFQQFVETDATLNSLATTLNQLGTPSPRGSHWTRQQTRQLINNVAYIGILRYGLRKRGKYHHVGPNGSIAKADCPEGGVVEVRDAHEGIIDPEVFEAAQAKLEARRRDGTPKAATAYPLTGVLYCGHCGARLVGWNSGYERKYVCRGAKQGPSVCRHRSIAAEAIEGVLVERLRDDALSPENLTRLEAELSRQATEAAAASGESDSHAKAIKRKLKELDANIKRGAETLLLVDADHMQDAANALNRWKKERKQIQRQLEGNGQGTSRDIKQTVDAALGKLKQLRDNLKPGHALAQRAVFREVLQSIQVFWDDTKSLRGKATRYKFRRAVVTFADSPALFHLVTRPSGRCFAPTA